MECSEPEGSHFKLFCYHAILLSCCTHKEHLFLTNFLAINGCATFAQQDEVVVVYSNENSIIFSVYLKNLDICVYKIVVLATECNLDIALVVEADARTILEFPLAYCVFLVVEVVLISGRTVIYSLYCITSSPVGVTVFLYYDTYENI